MSAPLVFDRSVCVGYSTRVFSVVRDAGTVQATKSRKQKDIQEVINPKHVGYLGRLKQEAFRSCRSHGTKLEILDVWIVPDEDEDQLYGKLAAIAGKWDDFVQQTLVPNYPQWVEKHAIDNPDEADDIRRLAPSVNEVQRQTRFVFASFRLNASQIKATNLDQEMGGLADQAVREIAAEIKDAGMDKSVSFTQQSKQVLKRMAKKARSLAYLHPRLQEIADTVDRLTAALPHTGPIKDLNALAIRGVLDALLRPGAFMQRGFGIDDDDQMTLELPSPASAQADPLGKNDRIAAHVAETLQREEDEEAPTDGGRQLVTSSDWNW